MPLLIKKPVALSVLYSLSNERGKSLESLCSHCYGFVNAKNKNYIKNTCFWLKNIGIIEQDEEEYFLTKKEIDLEEKILLFLKFGVYKTMSDALYDENNIEMVMRHIMELAIDDIQPGHVASSILGKPLESLNDKKFIAIHDRIKNRLLLQQKKKIEALYESKESVKTEKDESVVEIAGGMYKNIITVASVVQSAAQGDREKWNHFDIMAYFFRKYNERNKIHYDLNDGPGVTFEKLDKRSNKWKRKISRALKAFSEIYKRYGRKSADYIDFWFNNIDNITSATYTFGWLVSPLFFQKFDTKDTKEIGGYEWVANISGIGKYLDKEIKTQRELDRFIESWSTIENIPGPIEELKMIVLERSL